MFFTEGVIFTFGTMGLEANLNFNNALLHISKDSRMAGLRYKFAIATWDFKQKEAHLGVFFE